MARTFSKTIRREFKQSFGRFISITAIIALAVGFVLGLMTTPSALQKSVDSYYHESETYDLNIKSSMGVTEDDVTALNASELVRGVMAAYTVDVLTDSSAGLNIPTKVYGLPDEALTGAGGINRLELVSGRYPESADECLVERSGNNISAPAVGSTVKLTRQNQELVTVTEYTVTGIVGNPLYIDKNAQETASIGNGKLGAVLYVDEDCFSLEIFGTKLYTDVFVTLAGGERLNSFSSAYAKFLSQSSGEIRTLLNGLNSGAIFAGRSWYMFDRQTNTSFTNYFENTDKVSKIAAIFPVFFLLVAALVSLSTMTRMVEEDRLQIGTLKSLGYSKLTITSKYLIYCLVATAIGCVIGLIGGFTLIPNIIYFVFRTSFHLPALSSGFSWLLAVIITGAALLLTALVTIFTALKSMREKTARLLQPRAPKPGKRILLERVKPVWKRLPFKYKATLRNVFRQKKQLFMTVIGVAGCVALLMAGFGLYDSIITLSSTQYDELTQYDCLVSVESAAYDEPLSGYLDALGTENYFELYSEYAYAVNGDTRLSTPVYAADTDSGLTSFVTLQERKSGKKIAFGENSVIMSEMLAKKLDVKVGGTFRLSSGTDETEYTLTAIAENYLGSFIYFDSALFAEANPGRENNLIYVKDAAGVADGSLSERLGSSATVAGLQFIEDIKENYGSLINSIVNIVFMLIVAAGGLCIIVLYNLLNINISERKKEISTLKVLGYKNTEVAGYIFRESVIMVIMGILLGLGLGVLLHYYLVLQIDTYTLMAGRAMSWVSFVAAFLISLGFSAIASLIMLPKMKKIKMVDSMKANE